MKFKSETELAKIMINYLKDIGWEVFQEVQCFSYGNVADIVAKQGNLIWVLECKRSLSLSLIAQAKEWVEFANYVSIVIPYKKRQDKGANLAYNILKHYGIGCYQVRKYGKDWYSDNSLTINSRVSPKFNRKAMTNYITKSLTEKHKYWAEAGNNKGLRYTPFQDTKDQLIRKVKSQPGLTVKELIESVNHHYASDATAKTSILQWIHKGIISELELKRDGKCYKVYLKE